MKKNQPSGNNVKLERSKLETLCDEIENMGDVLACYIINQGGELLAANYGQIPVDENLKRDFSQVAATIWGGLLRVTDLGGPIRMVSAIYENFKIIGLPIAGTNLAILLTVEVKIDSYALKDRIAEFMKYWVTSSNYAQ